MLISFSATQSGLLEQIALHGPAAAAVNLSALDRLRDMGTAGITDNYLHLGPKNPLEHIGKDTRVGTERVRSGDKSMSEKIVPFFDVRCMPGHADAGFICDTADPGKLRGVEQRLFVAQQRLHEDAAVESCDFAAVAFHDIVDAIGGRKASGAGLIYDNR